MAFVSRGYEGKRETLEKINCSMDKDKRITTPNALSQRQRQQHLVVANASFLHPVAPRSQVWPNVAGGSNTGVVQYQLAHIIPLVQVALPDSRHADRRTR